MAKFQRDPRPADQLNRRERVWLEAVNACLMCAGVTVPRAIPAADEVLAAFDERFGK